MGNKIVDTITAVRRAFPEVDDFETMRIAMRLSIPVMAVTCFPKTVPLAIPDVHFELYDLLENQSIEKSAVALPRGLAKSSITSFLYVMWMLANKLSSKDLFITIISESQSQSVNFITRIKNALTTNAKFRHYFGDLGSNTAARWREDDIVLANGARVTALGTGQKVRGNIQDDTRPNVLILDDFESETNANTPESRLNNRKWIMEAVIPSLSQTDGRIICIGTTISEDCFLQWVKDDPDWKVIWKSVLDEEGKSIWPEMYPIERIESIRRGFEHMGNLSGFFQEYMNQPQSPDDAPFQPHYMKTYSGIPEEIDGRWYLDIDGDSRLLNVFMGVDLASSLGKKADYTVLATVGRDTFGNEYLLDIERSKSNPALHPDMIIAAFKKWHHQGVYIESVAYQESCRQMVRAKMIEEGLFIPGLERKITHRTSKSERLISLVPLFAQGKFHFRTTDLEAQREFLSFPKGKNDDLLDAIWLASSFGYKPNQATKGVNKVVKAKKFNRNGWMTA